MEDKTRTAVTGHDIMRKPLPEILEGIGESIALAEQAAADARKAAEEARLAGQVAAEQVMQKIRKLFLKMSHDITEELKETGKKN